MSNQTDELTAVSPVTKQSQPASELKFVITSITIPTQLSSEQFASLIKTANDSGSFNISLEFKSISQNTQKKSKSSSSTIQLTDLSTLTTAIDNRNTIHSVIAGNDSIKNVDVTSILFTSDNKPFSSLLSCSTPIKPTIANDSPSELKLSYSWENSQLDAMVVTPPSIDDNCERPGKDSMSTEQCHVAAERTLIASDCDHSRNADKSKSFNRSHTPITVAKLAVRRNSRNTRRSKVFKFFTQNRRTPKSLFRQSAKKKMSQQNVRYRNDGDPSDNTSRSAFPFTDLGCLPMLTTENVNGFARTENDLYDPNDLDFSFVCEPSTSDIEADALDLGVVVDTDQQVVAQSSADTSKLVITIDRCLSNFEQNTEYVEAHENVKSFPRKLSKSDHLGNTFVRRRCSKFEKITASSKGLTCVS